MADSSNLKSQLPPAAKIEELSVELLNLSVCSWPN